MLTLEDFYDLIEYKESSTLEWHLGRDSQKRLSFLLREQGPQGLLLITSRNKNKRNTYS